MLVVQVLKVITSLCFKKFYKNEVWGCPRFFTLRLGIRERKCPG